MIRKPFRVASPLEGENGRGDWIRGDIRFAEGPAPRTAVVVLHGFKGFKDFSFFPHLCEQLARRGHVVVNFDLSHNGIGEVPGEFTELEKFARNTYTRELAEIDRVVELVAEGDLLPRRIDRIGIVGHSRGGAMAIVQTAEDGRVDGLVTWGAISCLDRWTPETIRDWREDGRVHVLNTRTGQQMPLDVVLLDDYQANAERLDVRAAGSRVAVPWLVLHGEDDLTVPLADAEALVGANPEARMVMIEKAGHGFEAKHPFAGSPPQLDRAVALTADHFRIHWDLD